jgi:hypothetical protein
MLETSHFCYFEMLETSRFCYIEMLEASRQSWVFQLKQGLQAWIGIDCRHNTSLNMDYRHGLIPGKITHDLSVPLI